MKSKVFCIFLLFLGSQVFATEKEIIGKVVKISDGDTIRVLQNKKEFKIRFFGIDAPEKDQAFGQIAKQKLSELIFRKEVTVLWKEKDRYNRYLGVVYLKELNINQEMVRSGYAWAYRRYSEDSAMIDLEQKASEDRLGLWQEKNPIPPWEFRKKQRADKNE